MRMAVSAVKTSVWITSFILFTGLGSTVWWIQAHQIPAVPTIAFIPQAGGEMLSEIGHFGATTAAEGLKCRLYWNAPTSETDVPGQVSLVDRIARGKYQGLVLAPNHPFAILAPLQRVLALGVPVVVISAPLDIPSNSKFGYVVNDDERMGELAATEVARLIHGRGAIVLVGVARYVPGVMLRARGAERVLANQFPGIRVVSRLGAASNADRAEELSTSVLASHPSLNAFLSLTAISTRGVHAALKNRSSLHAIHLVGCEQDSDLVGYVESGEIAAVMAENVYRMGYEAVGLIAASWGGKPIPSRTVVPPLMITKQNFNSAETRLFVNFPR